MPSKLPHCFFVAWTGRISWHSWGLIEKEELDVLLSILGLVRASQWLSIRCFLLGIICKDPDIWTLSLECWIPTKMALSAFKSLLNSSTAPGTKSSSPKLTWRRCESFKSQAQTRHLAASAIRHKSTVVDRSSRCFAVSKQLRKGNHLVLEREIDLVLEREILISFWNALHPYEKFSFLFVTSFTLTK